MRKQHSLDPPLLRRSFSGCRLPLNHERLDISRLAVRWSMTGSVRAKAMLNGIGAAINVSHVTAIAVTSNR